MMEVNSPRIPKNHKCIFNDRVSRYVRQKVIELQGETDDHYYSSRLQHPGITNGQIW